MPLFYTMEAIILAGGLGTRLREAVTDVPKCLARVQGKPFLHYLISLLQHNGVTRFVFSVGYLAHQVIEFLQARLEEADYRVVFEEEPLGTGGAVMKSLAACQAEAVWVVNGDTYFDAPWQPVVNDFSRYEPLCTLLLKEMQDFDRYGSVQLNQDGFIAGFFEKKWCSQGYINSGTYLFNRSRMLSLGQQLPEKFSLENELLVPQAPSNQLRGCVCDGYFIDIGIPEDYFRANEELPERVGKLAKLR